MDLLYKKKYQIIYADPPWHYRNKGLRGVAENHYPILKNADIENLPIQNITSDNCALFLWVPFPKLTEGLDIIKAWGFNYKTAAFVWVKLNKTCNTLFTGLGFYTRSNSEVCLLATKGKLERQSKSVHSVVIAKRQGHSRKPRSVRKNIVNLFGDIPRIELFATEKERGWDSTGFELDGIHIEDFLNKYSIWTLGGKRQIVKC